MKIVINKIINASNAISHSDGLTIYDYIKSIGKDGKFIISFEGINRVSTAFLNACIGKMILEGSYKNEYIDRERTEDIILKKIDSVASNAINYEAYDQIVTDAKYIC